MYSAQQSDSGSSYPLAQGLHRDLLVSTLFWSNLASQAPVNRFFCDAAAMRLRFGCDAKRESPCEMIDSDDPLLKTLFPSLVASCRARGRSMSLQFRGRQRNFEAGRHIARHTGTLWDRHLCMLRSGAKLVTKWLQKGVREKVDATDH